MSEIEIPSNYKYPFICCNFDPLTCGVKLDKPEFNSETVKTVNIHIMNELKKLKLKCSYKYYEDLIPSINETNYKTNANLLTYLFADDKVRLQITFDESEDINKIYSLTFDNSNNLLSKILYIYFAINSTHHKIIPFDKIEEWSKNKTFFVTWYYNLSSDKSMSTYSYYDTLLLSKLFLNKNSLEILSFANFNIFKKMLFSPSFNKLNFLLENFNKLPFIDREFVIVRHGFTSWGLGMRNFSDLDIGILNVKSKEFKIFAETVNPYIKIDEIGIIPGDKYVIRNYQYAFLSREYLDVTDTYTHLFNPVGHAYLFGIKIYPLHWHMMIRYITGRPRDCTEILYFNETTSSHFPLPPFPKLKLEFETSEGRSYHAHSAIDLMKKYGINQSEPFEFANSEKYYINVILFKVRKFVKAMNWNKYNINELYNKYVDAVPLEKFLKFIAEWDLPGMIKLSMLDNIDLSNITNSGFFDVIKKLEIQKSYEDHIEQLYKFIANLTKSTSNILTEMDLTSLSSYEDSLTKLLESDIKPKMPDTPTEINHPLGDKYWLLNNINKWKLYYNRCEDFLDEIEHALCD